MADRWPRFSLAVHFRLKQVNQRANAILIYLLSRIMPAGVAHERPDWGARPHRILYLRYDRIGDMIVSTSLIEAIATSHPSITLDVLASPLNALVLAENPHVGSVIVFDRKRPLDFMRVRRELRRRRYDAVVDCMILSPSTTSLFLMLASGARWRIGVGGRRDAFAFTHPVAAATSAVHHIDHSSVLASAFGVETSGRDWRSKIYLSPAERLTARRRWAQGWASEHGGRPPRVLVNISAGHPRRRWPDERFAAVADHIRQREPDASVMVIAAPAETDRGQRVAAAGGALFVNTPTLREAFGLISEADLVVTPDTGLSHAASALGIPAVVLIPLHIVGLWGLYGTPGRCVPSADGNLLSLAVAPVLAAIDALLEEIGASQTQPVTSDSR